MYVFLSIDDTLYGTIHIFVVIPFSAKTIFAKLSFRKLITSQIKVSSVNFGSTRLAIVADPIREFAATLSAVSSVAITHWHYFFHRFNKTQLCKSV